MEILSNCWILQDPIKKRIQ